jgi:hypothetical protein
MTAVNVILLAVFAILGIVTGTVIHAFEGKKPSEEAGAF